MANRDGRHWWKLVWEVWIQGPWRVVSVLSTLTLGSLAYQLVATRAVALPHLSWPLWLTCVFLLMTGSITYGAIRAIRKREDEIARRPLSLDTHPRWEQRYSVRGEQVFFYLLTGAGAQRIGWLRVTVEEPSGYCVTKQITTGETVVSEDVFSVGYPHGCPDAPRATTGRYKVSWQSEESGSTLRVIASAEWDLVIPSASASSASALPPSSSAR